MDLLASERLILSELERGDAERVRLYANDEAINKYLSFGEIATEAGAVRYVQKAISSATMGEERISYKLAILLKPERDFIGSCWLDIEEQVNRRASVGYFIDSRHWGNGYATEALRALINYGFTNLALHRIEATCDAEHIISKKVLEKAGLKREALMRQNRLRKNAQGEKNWADSCLYAIIESPQKTL